MTTLSQTPNEFSEIWDKHHITTIFPSDVRHSDVKKYLEMLKKSGLKVNEVGKSNAGREIFQMEFGSGPVKVFLWSQMHGDEPTATSALFDLFSYLHTHQSDPWVRSLADRLTIRAVPMLNPDGAESYTRRNLQGIDINRDAIALSTPEARLLKQLRDDWSPDIGFNLHNQGALTTVGRTDQQASVSLLVVFGDAAKTLTPGLERNTRIAAGIVDALNIFIPGHIARYSDEWTPTAFGDNFSAWGTPVILIETGALYGRDEMYLVKMNFIAIATALDLLASGKYKALPPDRYKMLPENTSGGLVDIIFRGGSVFKPGTAMPSVADIAAIAQRRRASFVPIVRMTAIGNLGTLRGLEEYDAAGFKIVHRFGQLKTGEFAELFFYKRDRVIDPLVENMETQFPPDAIFSGGKWLKGAGVVPRK